MRVTPRLRLWLLPLTTVISIAACNLDGDDLRPFGSSGSFGGTGGFFDAGGPVSAPEICASAALAAPCSPSMVCEIGEHPNPACNSILTCSAGRGRWEEDHSALPCDEDECPGAFVEQRDGGCDGPHAPTLRCAYPEHGYTCGCAPVFTDLEDGGTDAGEGFEDAGGISDAGADADGGSLGRIPAGYRWTCVKPESGCPRTRPPIGARCVLPMDCDYGQCVFEDKTNMGGLHLECAARGQWRIAPSRCP